MWHSARVRAKSSLGGRFGDTDDEGLRATPVVPAAPPPTPMQDKTDGKYLAMSFYTPV